jgi:hypothetical protein
VNPAIISSDTPNWFRGFIQGKTRITIAWIFAILLGITSQSFPEWPGMTLCFAGATLRFWASGYLRKDSRPAVGGPYAYVRNPLYLGTYLMALGAAWAIESWLVLALSTVSFAVIYHYIILDEETKLMRIFQGSYEHYSCNVPRFFPRIWPPLFPADRPTLLRINPDSRHLRFSWSLAMKNKAYEAYISAAGLIAYVSTMAYFWRNFRG